MDSLRAESDMPGAFSPGLGWLQVFVGLEKFCLLLWEIKLISMHTCGQAQATEMLLF